MVNKQYELLLKGTGTEIYAEMAQGDGEVGLPKKSEEEQKVMAKEEETYTKESVTAKANFKRDVKVAKDFRKSVTAHCPTIVCGVCSCYRSPKEFGNETEPE